MTEKFVVANIKCGGCANTIKNNLEKLVPASTTVVDFEAGVVEVTAATYINRQVVLKKLAALGYPEADQNNVLHQVKSMASCLVGRLD